MTNVILEKKALFIKKRYLELLHLHQFSHCKFTFPQNGFNALFHKMVSMQQCLISPYDVVAVKDTLYLMLYTVQYCLNLLYLIYCSVALN